MTEEEFWKEFRRILLALVSLIERTKTHTKPLTSELRNEYKRSTS